MGYNYYNSPKGGYGRTPPPPTVVSFSTILANYPQVPIIHYDSKRKKDLYENHCAIKVSDALVKSGVTLTGFKGSLCNNCPEGKRIHALGARDLAIFFQSKAGFPKPSQFIGATYEKGVDGKTGIIYFENYWQRPNEKSTDKRSGDHIDFWDKNELISIGYLKTLLRTTYPAIAESLFDISDLRRSEKVLFWEMK